MIKNHLVYNPVLEWKFKLAKAQGSLLWDDKGKRVIDFSSGWNTANFGWNLAEITQAIIDQAKKNTYAPSWVSTDIQEQYAKNLMAEFPKELDAVCRVTSGTEANEQAIKIARAVTGRKKVIGFNDTYHGSTFGSLSIGYRPEYISHLSPLVAEFIKLDFPASQKELDLFLEKLELVLAKKDVAAIITEAGIVTGWGSMKIAPKGYLGAVRDLTDKHGTMLILDEVGTGFSRLGKLFGHQIEKVIPDIVTLAKAMTNGVAAMGACLVNGEKIKGLIGQAKVLSSLAWMPLACSAAIKVLEIHKRNRLWETAEANGQWLQQELKTKIHSSLIKEIRGIGMEIGLEFNDTQLTKTVVEKSFIKGLYLRQSDDTIIQIMPPLNTPKEILKEGLDILTSAVV